MPQIGKPHVPTLLVALIVLVVVLGLYHLAGRRRRG